MTIPYVGSKAVHGVYQSLINLIPSHVRYIECFCGSAALYRKKRRAEVNILLDLNISILRELRRCIHRDDLLLNACSFDFLKSFQFFETDFLYLDPPYPFSCRSSSRRYYQYELSDNDHFLLLDLIRELPCKVMISSYGNNIYDERLGGWRRIDFDGMSRSGKKIETVYLNYEEPEELHQYDFLGSSFRERQTIRRKRDRIVSRINSLSAFERRALIQMLVSGEGESL